jgi:ceramide glucosyltransferase
MTENASMLVWILLACAAFSAGMTGLGIWSTIRHTARRRSGNVEGRVLPPLSVLKPIKGTEQSLEANLRSFFEQSYPGELEFVFASEELDDPGMAVARRVAADYPHVSTRFAQSDPDFGLNPKVANLAGAMGRAKHDLILQSDANVRVSPGYLSRIVAELEDEKASLLTSIVVGSGERSIGATFENLQLTAMIAPSVCLALHVGGVSCVIGKSMLLRQSELARVGGLEEVKDILAEDFILGQYYQEAGLKVVLSTNTLENVNQDNTVEQFFARHSRWMKMRVVIHLGAFVADLFANVVFWTFAAMIASGCELWTVGIFALTCAFQTTVDAFYVKRIRGEAMALRWLMLVPFKSLLMVVIWVYACFSRSVVWRGRKLRFGKESRLRDDEGNLGERISRSIRAAVG